MAHETAQQRYRRQRRDPYRAAQIAPSYDIAPARCGCGHARLMHAQSEAGLHAGRCVSCDCTEYREVTA